MEGLPGPVQSPRSCYPAFESCVSTHLLVVLTLVCVIHGSSVDNLVTTSYDRGFLDATDRAIKGGSSGSERAIVSKPWGIGGVNQGKGWWSLQPLPSHPYAT